MSKTARPRVLRQEGGSGEFVLIVPNAEFPHLSVHRGKLTKEQVRDILSGECGMSLSEIESLIRESPVVPIPGLQMTGDKE